MAKCSVCGNTIGFTFGTCINCHYNEQEGFKTIEVDIETLSHYMPFEVVSELLTRHAKKYTLQKEVNNNG